ncbi:MAG: hypothetical protein QOI00_1280, partial [Chloroflexota bacterium]|nr:hypothetical protein [Chloroflexota bacterium]
VNASRRVDDGQNESPTTRIRALITAIAA